MTSAASLRCRVIETPAGAFVLCDLTQVLQYVRKALRAGGLPPLPNFVVLGTTAMLPRAAMQENGLNARTASRDHTSDGRIYSIPTDSLGTPILKYNDVF